MEQVAKNMRSSFKQLIFDNPITSPYQMSTNALLTDIL